MKVEHDYKSGMRNMKKTSLCSKLWHFI